MSNVKEMGKLDKLDKLLRQNPHGIRITEAAGILNVARSTLYDWLNSKEMQGRAYYQRGIAYPKKPSETEITETTPFWKKQAFEDAVKLRNVKMNQDPDQLILLPEATQDFLDTYPSLNAKLKNERAELGSLVKWAYTKPKLIDSFQWSYIVQPDRLIRIAKGHVSTVLRKVFKLLHES